MCKCIFVEELKTFKNCGDEECDLSRGQNK